MTLIELLDEVKDKDTFIAFVDAFIDDRQTAAKLKKEDPNYWRWGGANDWQNSTIESFLEVAIACSESGANRDEMKQLEQENQWKWFADFLYGGKIYE